jgi:ribulose kinase
MDMRSSAQADQVLATGDPACEVNSGGAGPVSAEWMIGKALWMKQNEPETYAAAKYVCEYQDYLNFHLTGRMVASISNVSVRWHYNSSRGELSERGRNVSECSQHTRRRTLLAAVWPRLLASCHTLLSR